MRTRRRKSRKQLIAENAALWERVKYLGDLWLWEIENRKEVER